MLEKQHPLGTHDIMSTLTHPVARAHSAGEQTVAQGEGACFPSSRHGLRMQVPRISERNWRSNRVKGGKERGEQRSAGCRSTCELRRRTWPMRMVLPGSLEGHPGFQSLGISARRLPPALVWLLPGPGGDPAVSTTGVKDGAPSCGGSQVPRRNTKPQCLRAAGTAPSTRAALGGGTAPGSGQHQRQADAQAEGGGEVGGATTGHHRKGALQGGQSRGGLPPLALEEWKGPVAPQLRSPSPAPRSPLKGGGVPGSPLAPQLRRAPASFVKATSEPGTRPALPGPRPRGVVRHSPSGRLIRGTCASVRGGSSARRSGGSNSSGRSSDWVPGAIAARGARTATASCGLRLRWFPCTRGPGGWGTDHVAAASAPPRPPAAQRSAVPPTQLRGGSRGARLRGRRRRRKWASVEPLPSSFSLPCPAFPPSSFLLASGVRAPRDRLGGPSGAARERRGGKPSPRAPPPPPDPPTAAPAPFRLLCDPLQAAAGGLEERVGLSSVRLVRVWRGSCPFVPASPANAPGTHLSVTTGTLPSSSGHRASGFRV